MKCYRIGIFLLALLSPSLWAAPLCSLGMDSLPDPARPPGQRDPRSPIRHVFVIMQENHSFDNYFGRLNQPQHYGNQVDGVDESRSNPSADGRSQVNARHANTLCVDDPEHNWNAIHKAWNQGAMDGFVTVNGEKAMDFYDERDLPFYYDLADKFAIGDRYFSSVLTQTFPNRFFLWTGTAFGHIKNDKPTPVVGFNQKTLFDRLDEQNLTWRYYKNGFGYVQLFQPLALAHLDRIKGIDQFAKDLASGDLPDVAFIDSDFEKGEDEHPKANIQKGQAFVAERLQELAGSSAWRDSVLFVTWDEGGGFFDHVAPPEACVPDSKEPMLGSGDLPGSYDRYGVRVPFLAISPFARHHYVSHEVYDHASIVKYVEDLFNLPALTARDANSNALKDLFDYEHPDFDTKPNFGLAVVRGDCSGS
jgi:phospholipase C